ncbi:2',3'-cyclic-nucleotide 3'-phosphodiesterase [Patella vulgata]|uniref:2',3'-cyclic-nucleotide 3'-phosphodiesterase n=1 Tax=Patella vulgata TaxID=6465 RepID=UPI00217F90DD|nr:2',3'-cyclic-nucleotide 3'-phosphodiesterase [Patella vulgata]
MTLSHFIVFNLTCSPEEIILSSTVNYKILEPMSLTTNSSNSMQILENKSVTQRPRWLNLPKAISKFFSRNRLVDTVDGKEVQEIMAKSSTTPQLTANSNIIAEWMRFPFTEDKQTLKFIKESKIMFVIRGLSGSGKSTLVRHLQSIYHDSIVCSADNYFMKDGIYCFDQEKLSSAHEHCKEIAKKACVENRNVVIIDNTNVRYWEAKPYFNIASNYNYINIVASPKTPWKLDAKELSQRNKHDVDLITIQRKVNSFKDFIPFYYGWFVNEQLSVRLLSMGRDYFKECLELYPLFKQHLQTLCPDNTDGNLIKDYFPEHPKRKILHCTSRYVGKGRAEGGKEYHQREDVQNSYGKVFIVTLYGFIITDKTLGARIHLPQEALVLFDNPEERQRDMASSPLKSQVSPRKTSRHSPLKSPVSPRKTPKQSPLKPPVPPRKQFDTNAKFDECIRGISLLKTSSSQSKENLSLKSESKDVAAITTLFPLVRPKSRGRAAHMTLGIADKIQSKQTTIDLLDICDIEKSSSATPHDFQHVREGKSRFYDDSHCCIYLDKPYNIPVLFSGSY